MFDLLKTANDDQMALGICVLTLAGAAFFVFASFHLGPAGKKTGANELKNSDLKMISPTVKKSDAHHERAA